MENRRSEEEKIIKDINLFDLKKNKMTLNQRCKKSF